MNRGECGLYCNGQIPQQLNLQLQMTDNQVATQNSKILSLIRLKAECKIAPVRVDFEAPHRPNLPPTSIIPTFNHDQSYFTPSFVLPTDKKYYQENTTFQKYQFEEKIQRSVRETTSTHSLSLPQELLIAAPNSNYCQICQEKFENYFQHIELKVHRTRALHTEASAMIQELCNEIRNASQKDGQTGKTKGIRKDAKRQEKVLTEKKMNKSKKRQTKQSDVSLKGQNFSTCLLQDSMRQFNQ